MASKISMVRFKLSGALTHLPGSNIIDIPYAGGDSQAEFSTAEGINVLIINGGINTARSGKTIVDSGRTFSLTFNPSSIRMTWLDPASSIGDTDDLVLGLNALSNPNTSAGIDGEKVKITAADTTTDYLGSKLSIVNPLYVNLLNPGGNEQLEIGITANPVLTGTSHMGIPVGTTVQRPGAPVAGYFRANTTTNRIESYIGGAWHQFLDTTDIGTMATQSAAAVAITGGTIANVTATNLTISSLSTQIAVPQGGTGKTTLTAHALLLGNGAGAINELSLGAAGQILTSAGAGNDPAWASTIALTAVNITGGTALGAAPALDDLVPIYDLSTTTNKTVTVEQLLAPRNYKIFTASGSFVKASDVPTTVSHVIVDLWGAGGGGAGGHTAGGAEVRGAGGGGGGFSRKRIAVSALAASETVTIGGGGSGGTNGNPGTNGSNGGTTSFGAFHSATGGNGGAYSSSPGAGGAGGAGSGGDLNLTGADGGINSPAPGSPTVGWRGEGGAAPFIGVTSVGNVGVVTPANTGAGGIGGNHVAGSASAGSAGLLIVWW